MKYVTLGKTGLHVSRVGLGGIPIQKSNVEKVKTLVRLLSEKGVNYIDTARGYTVSEQLLGEALEGIRDKFVLATKSMSRTREAMEKDIETSLANLRTDYVDLYQVHNPGMADLETVLGKDGALEALLAAKEAGKIGHIGLTAHSLQVFEYALTLDWVETIMFPYNIVESQGTELMKKCTENNVGFIAMKPLAGGAIEDADLAIRYICSNPDATIVIPGMYSPAEVEQNLAAAAQDGALSAQDEEKIAQIRDALGENFCRRCNYCQPCTVGINISGVFLFAGYLQRYDLGAWGYDRYQSLSVKADECVECGECESRCPYHLPIRDMLKKCAKDFSDFETGIAHK